MVPKERWSMLLAPLLDETSAAHRCGMDEEDMMSYDKVKEALLSFHEFHRDYYRNRWNNACSEEFPNPTFHNIANDLRKTFDSWAKLEESTKEWMIREQFLKLINPEIRRYVTLQDPSSIKEAVEIAARFKGQNQHLTNLKPKWESNTQRWPRKRGEDRDKANQDAGNKFKEGYSSKPKEGYSSKPKEDNLKSFSNIKTEPPTTTT